MSKNDEEAYFQKIAQIFPEEVQEELVKQMRGRWEDRDYPERTGQHMIELLEDPCIKILLQNTGNKFKTTLDKIKSEGGSIKEKNNKIELALAGEAFTWVSGIDTFMGQKEFWWTKDGIPLATKQTRNVFTANRCNLPLIPDGASDGFPASLPPKGGVIEKEYLTKREEKEKKIGPSLDDYEWNAQKEDWILKKKKKGGKKKLTRRRRI